MAPVRFPFGLHLHQPVGNFDHVFQQHVTDVYTPFLDLVEEREFFPLVLHISGPLLEWMEDHSRSYLDRVGRLVSDGKLELLLAGFYEPILAALPREDRREQIGWMRDALERRFGVTASGLWLTERVWEPELAADLAEAGVEYALVDDRHFLAAGFEREQLHRPWRTESDGRSLTLFPIDERLRYLIPFRPPAEAVTYLRELGAAGHPLAVLADDGEKFGGWPGTHEWVYGKGWLRDFVDTMERLVSQDEVRLVTFTEALAEVPCAGLAYLPTASYREMEGWSLPARAALRLRALEDDLGEERLEQDTAFIRGGHWRNFLVKYPESNRMQKKAAALSRLCRARGNSAGARRAVGRAQCNDAYWHGVFGGLYLPHLRHAIWRELAAAEQELRAGEAMASTTVDADGDGHEEILVHSARFAASISPRRGGALEELTVFAAGVNLADTLTRRREAYHRVGAGEAKAEGGTASIHDIEDAAALTELPPVDPWPRAMFVDVFRSADGAILWAGATVPRRARVFEEGRQLVVVLEGPPDDPVSLIKRYGFTDDGGLSVTWRWNPHALPAGAVFAPETSAGHPVEWTCRPEATIHRSDITTVSMSERGFDHTVQGQEIVTEWPAAGGEAWTAMMAVKSEG